MFPAKFEYYAPATVKEAASLLSKNAGAKILAGGHSLLPAMKLRLVNPTVLVDIGKIPDLQGIRVATDGTTIGARTTHAMIAASTEMRERCPALSDAAAVIGDWQVRNRGTIGGSLAHADPAADYPAVILALEAEIKVIGASGERTIKAVDFNTGLMTTALRPDEVITEIRVPPSPTRSGSAYIEFPQPASHFAIVGVCAWLALDDKGAVSKASIGITGATAAPTRAPAAEAALQGRSLDDATIAAAAEKAAEGLDCLQDIHASAEYRAHLVRVYTGRAIRKAADRAK